MYISSFQSENDHLMLYKIVIYESLCFIINIKYKMGNNINEKIVYVRFTLDGKHL